jgi:TonB family protein
MSKSRDLPDPSSLAITMLAYANAGQCARNFAHGGRDKDGQLMPKAARKSEPVVAEAGERPAKALRKQRFNIFLVTDDESLWPLVGADLSADLILKQLDSVDELLATVPSGNAGIVLWDARGHGNPAAILSKLSLHSSRFVVAVLDDNLASSAWTLPLQNRQIVAHVGLPLANAALGKALESCREEIGTRLALLGDQPATSEPPANVPGKNRWVPIAVGVALMGLAGTAVLLWPRGGGAPERTGITAKGGPAAGAPSRGETSAVTATSGAVSGKSAEAMDEKVDALIEKAQQAMTDRHFIDPAAGSALNLYRDVLLMDPNNGEARQGLQRLEEILVIRVQSALDERKFDLALQFLETARSINANDRRLAALDDRIASLRAELGPAQITAALNAQNFDRAAQLIDDAARAKSLPAAKLAQLRDDLRKRRDDADVTRVLKMVDTRLQQGKLVEPRNDSAAFYLEQAKQAGVAPAALQPAYQEMQRQLALAVRGAIDAKHFADAERWLSEMRDSGASSVVTAGLQKDLTAARSVLAGPATVSKAEQPPVLDLAQTRLTQGKLLEPDNDNALYYVSQLRAADPKNAALPQLSANLQEQILERGRAALDAGDTAKAQSLLQAAAGLGANSSVEAFNDALRQKIALVAATPSGTPNLVEQSLTRLNKLEAVYPQRALESLQEGWVEIGFTVKPDGTVGNVHVLNASPPNTFEQAGIKAVSKLRYQPVMQGGKAIAVNSQVRVAFRIPK